MAETTFLLTEVVDSTRLWEADDAAMAAATARLDTCVAGVAAAHGGVVVKPRGEGDAHFLTFASPGDALDAAEELLVALEGEPLLAVRASCHVGDAELRDGDWYGTTVNRCARLRAVAHPRQVLVSPAAARCVPEGRVRSLGRHRLKDLDEPTEVFQLLGPRLADAFPPLPTLQRHHDLPLPLTSFVGRDRLLAEVVDTASRGRPVTLVGPPGVGKRRLALEAGRTLFERDVDADVLPAATWAPRGLPGEVVVRVDPLPPHDALRLFLDRLDESPTVDVTAAVDRLDGLPLAVELAARRATSLGIERLTRRLEDDPLTVLGGDRHADPPHHRSFRDALDHCAAGLDAAALAELRSADPPGWAAGWFSNGHPLPLLRPLFR